MKERGLFPFDHRAIGKVILCPFAHLGDPRPEDPLGGFCPGGLRFSDSPSGAAHRSGVAQCYQPGMDLLGSDLGFALVNRFFNHSSELVGALGTLLILHLCSKLLGVSLLNQLFDGVGRAAAELRCSVIRSKKIVSFDNFHGFLAILHIWALSLHGGMFTDQSILLLERALLFRFPKSDSQAALAASISDHENPRPIHAKRLSRMHFSWPFSCSSHGHIYAFFRVR